MPSIVEVKLPHASYQVVIASNILSQLGSYLELLNLGQKILLISNPEIFNHYGEIVVDSLTKSGFKVFNHLIPSGELYKTLNLIAQVYDIALKNHLERSSTMIALGGGVIGDMTGFAAATWLRGINFVQVPTSFLGMVDASIGGKTGVNHPQGKNLIGAFYQPRLVFIDPFVLKTLPVREFRAGMAEVIKYGIIWDRDLFSKLEQATILDNLDSLSQELLQTIITRSCQAKVDVVVQDEKEAELRAILNYGHTIGHAIESLTGYGIINHGEAVGMGMIAAGKIAVKLRLWTEEEAGRQDNLIAKVGLPTAFPKMLKIDEVINVLQTDKKVKASKVRFILPTEIGKVIISDKVSSKVIRDCLFT
ncbi:MAG: 3-dehydroquinate synthase [cyanobacterium endosymbiont of Rhopalodia musculus]|uniref:3-dehydroquinate synthase n=1 Tax=cyanobacterium endosymbiont of Epithemia clementina EcSB TaxID=3034674 RepID=UPI00247FFA89|nr:3-dehydroquinate synthase [cyanobacterium endosymbiont of Epithemia clementina EcSB]WGT68469.1 3-dehydroquinate synthase [cyanobacterium endosymbiont of Epithemia clementina EcSB]